jgi:uncharacterized membrane protein
LLLWVAAVIVAPIAIAAQNTAIARGSLLIYGAGHLVCHQRPERSFHIHGRQYAVCARCTGLYASALAGGLMALALGAASMRPSRARVWLGVAALPTLVTVGVELAGLAYPSNTMRMLSALPLGAGTAWLVIATLSGPGLQVTTTDAEGRGGAGPAPREPHAR